MTIIFNEQQLNNLQAFLNRVDLKGSEVTAFVEIMQLINKKNEQVQRG